MGGTDSGNYILSNVSGGNLTTASANYFVVIPTVIDQIVFITDQNENEDPKKVVDENAGVVINDKSGNNSGLPVCS